MDCRHAFKHAFHAAGECFVGEVLIGEHRVAPERWDVECVKDAAERWAFLMRYIGMPAAAEIQTRLPHAQRG